VGKFIIPCDFIIMDMDENSRVPIILGRQFLATAGVIIKVQASTISFQIREETVDFYFPPLIPSLAPIIPSPSTDPVHTVPLDAVSGLEVFDGDE